MDPIFCLCLRREYPVNDMNGLNVCILLQIEAFSVYKNVV